MTTRREVFPFIAGAAGLAAGATAAAADAKTSDPELRRVSYRSARTAKERDYFVYLPRGFAQQKSWPVMLFLHGNGERGDGKGELDYVLAHGPLYEAWVQKRDLPFVIISPQLPMFGMGEVDYIKNRTPAQIPRRQDDGVPVRPDERLVRSSEAMQGKGIETKLPDDARGPVDGWFEIEDELIAMVDRTLKDFKGDPKRVYLTGLSYGGFGAWYLASKYATRFAALAPVVGYGHPEHAPAIARARLPVWCFVGGRDPVVQAKFFYPVMNELEKHGATDVRLTNHEDLGHFTWVRVYGGKDLYDWFLRNSR